VSMDPWLDRLVGALSSRMEIMGVWVPGMAGVRGTGLLSEYCAGLCRPLGHGPAGWRSCRFVISSGAGLVGVYRQSRDLTGLCQPCRGRSWPGGDHKYLWIPGLKVSSHGDPAGLRGGSLG
jgi:hypothetical protein